MKNLLLILCILGVAICHAQSFNCFQQGARWVYYTYWACEPVDCNQENISLTQYVIDGDTIINGITYLDYYTKNRSGYVVYYNGQYDTSDFLFESSSVKYLRYDTATNRVYYLPDIDSTEKLMYDFNLQIGDSIPVTNLCPCGPVYYPIDSIDTINFWGTPVRRFFIAFEPFEVGNPGLPITLEGFGGFYGFTECNPYYANSSSGIPVTSLVCFELGDSTYPVNASCPSVAYITSVNSVQANTGKFSVGPVPVDQTINLFVDGFLPKWTTVYDIAGREIIRRKFSNAVDISTLQSGVYFIGVSDGNFVLRRKVVKL